MSASTMPMPKTTVYEYGCFIFGENNIRLAGQFPDIYSIAESSFKQLLSDKNLGFGILGTNA